MKILIGLLAVIFVLAYTVPVKTEFAYINDVTGSRKGYTVWFGNFKTGEWYQRTDLEDYAKDNNYPFEDDWVSYRGTGKTILNRSVSFSHGWPTMREYTPEMIDRLTADLTDEEKIELLDSFKNRNHERSKEPLSSSRRGIF